MSLLLVVLAAVVGLSSVPLRGAVAEEEPSEEELSEADRADLAWLDGVVDPAIVGKSFVEVRRGRWTSVRGFVVDDDGTRVRVVSPGLQEWSLERSPPGTPEDERVVVEPLRLVEACEGWLAGGPSPARSSVAHPSHEWPRPDEPSLATRAAVCAWTLYRAAPQRYTILVRDVLAHARSSRPGRYDPVDAGRPLRERMAEELAAAELFRVKEALSGTGGTGGSRPETRPAQLAALRAVVARFPDAPAAAEARGFVAELERLELEAVEHARTAAPLDKMTPEQRRHELVFRLRDQPPSPWFADWSMTPSLNDGPFGELVAGGLESVPALIDGLSDDALTLFGGGGRSGLSPYVLRVRDLCLLAIEQIAGRTFVPEPGTASPSDPRPVAAREVIEKWYAEAASGGEVDSLVAAVERGDWHSAQAAKTLLNRAPERVPGALASALEAPEQHALIRMSLLAVLAQNPGDTGVALLRAEATSERWTAFDVALLLDDSGDAEATSSLLLHWKLRRDGGGPPTTPPEQGTFRARRDELRELTDRLVARGDPHVVREIGDRLPERGHLARFAAVRALAQARAKASGDLAAAIDAALLSCLDDRMEPGDTVNPSQPAVGFALRTCDLAAWALARARGLPAPSATDPYAVRDAKVAAIGAAYGRDVALPTVDSVPGDVPGDPFTVWHVRIAPSADGVPAALVEHVRALLGTRLTGAALAEVAKAMIATGESASLDAHRPAGADGTTVTLSILNGASGGWQWKQNAIRNDGWVATGAGGHWSAAPPHRQDDIARLADHALAAPASERAWIHVVAVREPHD